MTQGIFVNGVRPKTKKAIKDAVKAGERVRIEATSMMSNEYDGPVAEMPENKTVYFVGPDPYTKRNFYGQIKRVGDKITVK